MCFQVWLADQAAAQVGHAVTAIDDFQQRAFDPGNALVAHVTQGLIDLLLGHLLRIVLEFLCLVVMLLLHCALARDRGLFGVQQLSVQCFKALALRRDNSVLNGV